jgi:plasmid maintenance system antidote protein VapI
MSDTKLTALKEFLDRPAINVAGICNESGVNRRHLDNIVAGDRNLTEETKKKLLPTLKRYGFSEEL